MMSQLLLSSALSPSLRKKNFSQNDTTREVEKQVRQALLRNINALFFLLQLIKQFIDFFLLLMLHMPLPGSWASFLISQIVTFGLQIRLNYRHENRDNSLQDSLTRIYIALDDVFSS